MHTQVTAAGRTTSVILVPHSDDILATAARRILEQGTQLPNLLNTVVLLPELQFEADLRRQLLEQARSHDCAALLGPHISTPAQWLSSLARHDAMVPTRARRELMLVEAMRQHPDVFGEQDPWSLGASLITLFDELTLHRIPIPQDLAAFTMALQAAYGIPDRLPEPLGLEARVVHQLWQAWHTQLRAEGLLDPGMVMLQQLAQLQQSHIEQQFFFVGFDELNNAELELITRSSEQGSVECLLYPALADTDGASTPMAQLQAQANTPAAPGGALGECLDAVFTRAGDSLQTRARQLHERHSASPLTGRIHSLAADSAEQEARAIDLQVRRWLIDGHQPIGIVTEDRRLGRRVRALLERAGITLQDPGGWALSTTRAAGALERWLQSVEEDFAHQPLLDVLKSGYILPEVEPATLAASVYRLETDIVRHGNIARGLWRYHAHIERRLQHLNTPLTAETAQQLHQLLNRLDQAADPLRDCLSGAHPAQHMLAQLRNSLQTLGMWERLEDDPAGARILQEWRLLFEAAQHSELAMDWPEFRGWLGNTLERHDFRPASGPGPVTLLTLQQAQTGRFAGLIIAACDSQHLPVMPARSPFFNDPVRAELGLPAWPEHYQLQLNRFRHLLECAPQVLLTWHREENGEQRTPSPWLALLEAFQQLAWRQSLHAADLATLLKHPGTRVAGQHPLPLPRPMPAPRVALPSDRLPRRLSVSAHGSLIDCPYQFFAASGLQLKAREEVKLALEKADYGSLVHQALEIFHQGRAGYPPAFRARITQDNQQQAIDQLQAISARVFTHDVEDNYEHRAWARRWQALIPLYIDWQREHQAAWSFAAGEQDAECALSATRSLHGRLDRIDHGTAGADILDYKTGAVPPQDAVEDGEAVQLPSYALLTQQTPVRVEYVVLDSKVESGPALEGTVLAELTQAVQERLQTLLTQLESGSTLPAWGDDDTCRYCDMDGLCRRQAWKEDHL